MAFKEVPNDTLVGKFFLGNGWQGYVESSLGEGFYLVQLYEWMCGTPSSSKVISLRQASNPSWEWFYEKDHWHDHADHSSESAAWRSSDKHGPPAAETRPHVPLDPKTGHLKHKYPQNTDVADE